ncbi:MAG: hypothetical protein GX650_03175 [Clostridiales bacterium]|nr:hypothetical protein [Clostridiales bacterium]
MEENTVVNPQDGQAAQGDAAQGAARTEAEVKTPETGVNTGDAAPQEKTDAERFSFALKKRVDEERQKIEQESLKKYENDLTFATEVRKAFAGKGDQDIMSDLLSAQARVFATENGISEELAREFIELKRAVKPPTVDKPKEEAPHQDNANDAWMARLAKQRDAIKADHGVDVLEGMSEAEESAVMSGNMDLNEVFAHRNQNKTPPVNRGVATQPTPKDYSKMTDDEYAAFRKQLSRQGKIDIRSD